MRVVFETIVTQANCVNSKKNEASSRRDFTATRALFCAEESLQTKRRRRRHVYKTPSSSIIFGSLVNLESCCYNQKYHV